MWFIPDRNVLTVGLSSFSDSLGHSTWWGGAIKLWHSQFGSEHLMDRVSWTEWIKIPGKQLVISVNTMVFLQGNIRGSSPTYIATPAIAHK